MAIEYNQDGTLRRAFLSVDMFNKDRYEPALQARIFELSDEIDRINGARRDDFDPREYALAGRHVG